MMLLTVLALCFGWLLIGYIVMLTAIKLDKYNRRELNDLIWVCTFMWPVVVLAYLIVAIFVYSGIEKLHNYILTKLGIKE